MRTLKISNIENPGFSGDFETDPNTNRWIFIDGLDAIAQRIKHRLKLFAGEWFLDKNEGVDWIDVFEKPFSIRKMKAEIIKAISRDEAVTSIEKLDVVPDYATRKLIINLSLIADGEKINIDHTMND